MGKARGRQPQQGRGRPIKTLIANANAAALKSHNTLDRANALIAQAGDAVSEVEKQALTVLTELLANAVVTMEAAQALLEAIQSGVTVTAVREGEGTIMDFVMGRIDKLPLGLYIDPGGDEEDEEA